MRHTRTNLSAATLILALAFTWHLIAGSLDPSEPPGPTMKTLDQVEPRIPIPGTPGRTIAETLVIDKPGSYYLTSDRFCAGRGIKIESDNVTIDLMGYSLKGDGIGDEDGIYTGADNVEIRNGTIRGFGHYDINAFASAAENCRVIGVRITSNGQGGIYLAHMGCLVKDCTVTTNGVSADDVVYAIYTSYGAVVTGNMVSHNGTGAQSSVYGIRVAGYGSVAVGNTACYNGTSASGNVYGIHFTGNAVVDQNAAYGNSGVNMNHPGSCAWGVNVAP